MKKSLLKNTSTILFLIAVVVCVCFFVHVLTLNAEYSAGINEQAAGRAEFYANEQVRYIENQCDTFKTETDYYAAQLLDCDDLTEFSDKIKNIRISAIWKNQTLIDVFYFTKEGVFKGWQGNVIGGKYSEIEEIRTEKDAVVSKIFQYNNETMTFAVISENYESDYFDRIVFLYDVQSLSVAKYAYLDEEKTQEIPSVEKSDFTLLCKHNGKIIDRIVNNDKFNIGNEAVSDGIIKSIFTEVDENVAVLESLQNGKMNSFIFEKDNADYVLTVNSFGNNYGNLSLVCAYKDENVYGEGYREVQSIWATLVGFSILIFAMTSVLVTSKIAEKRQIYRMEMVDRTLNCATPKKFEKNVEEIVKRLPRTDFALVSLKINNFGYITERYGDEKSVNLSKFAARVVHNMLTLEETFAYAGDGEFLVFLRYKDKQSLSERLSGAFFRLAEFDGLDDSNYKIGISFAVYEKKSESKETAKSMLEKLKMVKQTAVVKQGTSSINFYEDVLHTNYMKKAEIEGRMEKALINSEFHLFYQPKYNLNAKKPDGSEILIRWYDPEISSYRVPSEFLPVFEENGFINKLDRFVFFKACQNIAERIANKKICYPVSVNVSRVTAIQPDFIEYYERIKNKYSIKDGFITLEFTESFAYENYEYLSEIVEKLHQKGFLCSIDDFGTGYSSYNILKNISMDEIKLDKFFLQKGVSKERDLTLLKSVIEMVKKLGMKVTQEGVETREDLNMMQELGCDVIQGYYFAKPLKYVDYCEFIDVNFNK